jgi:hypothetical protein
MEIHLRRKGSGFARKCRRGFLAFDDGDALEFDEVGPAKVMVKRTRTQKLACLKMRSGIARTTAMIGPQNHGT